MKNIQYLVFLFILSTSSIFSQSQDEFCKLYTQNSRNASVNFNKSYFTHKANAFVQVVYLDELAKDSNQDVNLMEKESKESGYINILTSQMYNAYKAYGLKDVLKTYGFSSFQVVLIYRDQSKLYSDKIII